MIMNNEQSQTLFHYTTLQTLAHIISSKKIMLRPITEMDDLLEDLGDVFSYGRYVFVSSWINDKTESIAMWKLYSDMKSGVRIELRRNPFRTYRVSTDEVNKFLPGLDMHCRDTEYILPFEKCIEDGAYLIEADPNKILEKVEYVENPRDLTKDSVVKKGLQAYIAMKDFGKYKSKYWEFQNEERYVLRFLPFDAKTIRDTPDAAYKLIQDLMGPSKMPKQIFLEIDDDAFGNMSITKSPEFEEGNDILLSALKDKYNPQMQIFDSDLKGKIRT